MIPDHEIARGRKGDFALEDELDGRARLLLLEAAQ
jgi:hypothetical protein